MAAPTKLPAVASGAAATFELEEEGEEELDCDREVAEEPVVALVADEDVVVESAAVVEESDEPVVAEEAEDSEWVEDSDGLDDDEDEAFWLQTTWSGVLTPAEEQICLAYCTAWAWSALLHAELRQQAMFSRNSAFLQMQPMSSCWQPAIWEPVVNWATQGV